MLLVPLDAGWAGVAGAAFTLIGTLAAPVIVRRLGREDFERRLRADRDNATMQHAREVAREHRRSSLDAYISFLGVEERLFFAVREGTPVEKLRPGIAGVSEALMRVRLLSPRYLQDKASTLWTAISDLLETYEQSRQLPTEADAQRALEPKIKARGEALRVCEATMSIELDRILEEAEQPAQLGSPGKP